MNSGIRGAEGLEGLEVQRIVKSILKSVQLPTVFGNIP